MSVCMGLCVCPCVSISRQAKNDTYAYMYTHTCIQTHAYIHIKVVLIRNFLRIETGVGAATDSRQLLDSRVHSSLVVTYSRVRHTRVGRTLEYATPGL